MRSIYALIIFLFCTATIMAAQETPKFELFGGYSFAHANTRSGSEHANMNGWNSSVAYNFNKWVGIVLDGSGTYSSRQVSEPFAIAFVCPTPTTCPPSISVPGEHAHDQIHTYSIGPQFSYRTESRFTPFAHVLFGGGYASHRTDFGASRFSEANGSHVLTLGGGFDVRLNSLLALRTQTDLLQTHFFHNLHYGVRVSTGIVFRFGSK